MTDRVPDPARRGLAPLLAALLALAAGVLVILAVLYFGRRQLAREAVTGWLRSKGIASESSFQELGPGRLVGRLRIGAPSAPDLVVDRAEVDYSLAGLLAGRGVEVTAIRLERPILKAEWRAGALHAGALDPLIAEFRKRPSRPGAPSPRIEIDQGRLQLATDYGLLRATADALIRDGKVVRLDAAADPTALHAADLDVRLKPWKLSARSAGERLTVQLVAPFDRLAAGKAAAADGALTLSAALAYPDLARPAPTSGSAVATLVAASAEAPGAASGPLRLDVRSRALTWSRAGGDRLAGDLSLQAQASHAVAGALQVATASAAFHGDFDAGSSAVLHLAGDAEGRGAWTGLGAPAAEDSAEIRAVKRAAHGFRAAAQGLGLTIDARGAKVRLAGLARLLPDTGGEVRLAPAGPGWRLTSAGGGLPTTQADVRRFVLTEGGATAAGAIKTHLSIGPLQNADVDAGGALAIAGGQARFSADRCAQVSAARFDLGQNDAEKLSTRFCPAGAPLFEIGKGGWRLTGRAEQASAAAPFLQASLTDGAGSVRLADDGGRLSADLAITEARIRDAAPDVRFRPMLMSGRLALAHDLWNGALDFRLPSGAHIAHAVLRHEDKSASGGVEIETGRLAFAQGALQPADLSPAAEPLGAPVTGSASFTGAFRWSPAGQTSGGELAIEDMGFKSPIGQVSGVSGKVRLTSLAPLIAPPGQILHAERIAAALPVTDVTTNLQLEAKALLVTGGRASAGGGQVIVQSLTVPLEKNKPVEGRLRLEGVQLHDLVKASPFGDRVSLDAKVSGEIPFQILDGRTHVSGGELHAVAPGRLSISRAALTSVSAAGSAQAPAPAAAQVGSTDTFTDFAYQALENLAFDKLQAQVDTRSDGRLGVVFHIAGYHDPPQHQEIRLSWLDLIQKKFLGKTLPLPSGTGVDLTLDTTLNLDDLLNDYAQFERLRSSPKVQP